MSNFTFLPAEFKAIADSAAKAEGHIIGDPRAACFHARFTLESIIHWLYRHDPALAMPYERNLGALLHEPTFLRLVPETIFQKARVIQKVGNQAVHNAQPMGQRDALQVVKELHHLCYWLTHTYMPDASRAGAAWQDQRVPPAPLSVALYSRKKLALREKELAQEHEKSLQLQQERDALNEEIQALRQQFATVRAVSETQVDTHDYSEDETRRYLIDVDLRRAGWPLDQERDREYKVTGMPNKSGIGKVDYVLWGDDGKPLAVVEAKKSSVDPAVGQQQAKLYADCLEKEYRQRPLIFYTNGYDIYLWDDTRYPPRKVAGFYKKDALARLILRRTQQQVPDKRQVQDAIAGRYYQTRAIGSIVEQFTAAHRKALLVMATGTGKTRTAIALVDLLQRAGWVKRALFLADRVALVNQACNAFKNHLPDSSPVNLVTEKESEARVYVCTYPTMTGLINEASGDEARFGVGHFDLIIIDEAHRSIYQKYRNIFDYFDSLLVGLTATPREEVDKNTYALFDLAVGAPTDTYELERAVADGYLVPPRVEQVDLRFPRDGIDYDALTEAEQAQWESLDWGDAANGDSLPDRVNATAINSWLFNKDTVDKALQHLMERGHKVQDGERLAKTIIFARNHDHATFIEERFNHHYRRYAGHFARVIDHKANYAQSLIDDFSQPEKAPHIAISVDMLDTGIDVPAVANLVFFKPVYSKIKFWQMIGRGTRLCPDLFGLGMGKEDFRIFDFCFNFDFFRENPEGISASATPSLSTRLFRARTQLLGHLQANAELDGKGTVSSALTDLLHSEVGQMNRENFIVRGQLAAVERFQQRPAWDQLSKADQDMLEQKVAGLPSEMETDSIESRRFDLIILRMQLAHVEGDAKAYDKDRLRIMEIAMSLERKKGIPAVDEQLAYLAEIQDHIFWQGIDLALLEEIRLRLRLLIPFLDKKSSQIVYTDFEDDIRSVRETEVVYAPKMTGLQYSKKVDEYLQQNLDHPLIQRLRTHQPLTPTDLAMLAETLAELGEEEGKRLLDHLLEQRGAPSLVHFILSRVGMNRAAAQAAFAPYLNEPTLTQSQRGFIKMIIEQLATRGFLEAAMLYESPFTNFHAGGPDQLFNDWDGMAEGIFEKLEALYPITDLGHSKK